MQTFEAIYKAGQFQPLMDVDVHENQKVRLAIVPFTAPSGEPDWLTKLREHHRIMEAKYGVLPDSTAIIREDRDRDG